MGGKGEAGKVQGMSTHSFLYGKLVLGGFCGLQRALVEAPARNPVGMLREVLEQMCMVHAILPG
jgi:hypothetical protein